MSICVYVRTYVRLSTKSFFDFDEILHVGRGRWLTHDGMQLTWSKVKITSPWKLAMVCSWPDLRSRSQALESWKSGHFQKLSGYDSFQMPTRIGAKILGWRLSGNLCHCCQATSVVRWHRVIIRTKDKDHAGDEAFRGRRPSHLKQFISRCVNCYWRSLDIWRPTCLVDQQRVWGLLMMRSINLLVIIIVLVWVELNVRLYCCWRPIKALLCCPHLALRAM